MSLSCQISFPAAVAEEVAGFTRDISRSGLCVRLPGSDRILPGVGTVARVQVALPHSPHFPPKCLDCSAKVVRVEWTESGEPLVALEMRRVRFGAPCSLDQPASDDVVEMRGLGFLQ